MMTNLFSIFDPSTSIINMKINWMSTLMGLSIMPMYYWVMNNRLKMIILKPSTILNNEFKMLLNISKNKGTTLIFISLFMMIMINNILGLFPYIFTSTSHLTMTLTLALPLWLSFMLFGWMKNTESMFMHLVPTGTPSVLMPFMVCIETISNVIRPGTLSVRLTANMIAGHLILTLLGNTTMNVSFNLLPIMLLIQMMLLTLETAVAIIQGYVFALLSTLYASEVN
uniref:ATP synthase subunit a n=3 Tax=Clonopsis TaxID=89388 RepID=A0A0B4MJC8_9NEOP|nr:ATP synthase 6 [Clonopsis soumiae]AHZ01608.1 ATP synthase 6 [Clonopsis sp. androgenes-35]AHZ01612.1 ATP synthase 6 [Clonopsis sp. androgenes-53]AHZ01596.1 ATP synthase 6 [Clonopsis soumiae]AHZ01604.1 ATP synthase 6 [Clonopsis soumiae]